MDHRQAVARLLPSRRFVIECPALSVPGFSALEREFAGGDRRFIHFAGRRDTDELRRLRSSRGSCDASFGFFPILWEDAQKRNPKGHHTHPIAHR